MGLSTNLLEWIAFHDPQTVSDNNNINQAAQVAHVWIDEQIRTNAGAVDEKQLKAALDSHLNLSKSAKRHVHAETLLAALGGLAGCAAAEAMWRKLERDPARIGELRIYQRNPGYPRYFEGTMLNGWIFPVANGERFHLWDQFVTGAHEAGFANADSQLALPMIESVLTAIREDKFGRLSVPFEHQPRIALQVMVERLWHGYKNYLAAVSAECWPTLTAMVARNFIVQVKDVLEPRLALTIVTESAFFMAKIDPEALDLDRGKRLADWMKTTHLVQSEHTVN